MFIAYILCFCVCYLRIVCLTTCAYIRIWCVFYFYLVFFVTYCSYQLTNNASHILQLLTVFLKLCNPYPILNFGVFNWKLVYYLLLSCGMFTLVWLICLLVFDNLLLGWLPFILSEQVNFLAWVKGEHIYLCWVAGSTWSHMAGEAP